MNRAHLLNLADRCDAGADELTYEAEHAAEVLAGRGHPEADPQAWAVRKTAAAAAARRYAQGLRAEAASMRVGDRPTEARIREAEKVADAANLGGILIDGSRLSEAAADNAWSTAERQAIEAHQRAETAAIEGSGVFAHVAEPGQVPFWQLGSTDQARTAPTTGRPPPRSGGHPRQRRPDVNRDGFP
jgi:hypothetical protein